LTHNELVCGYLKQSIRYENGVISGYCSLNVYQKCKRIPEPGWNNSTCPVYKKMIVLPLIEEGWLDGEANLTDYAKNFIENNDGDLSKIKSYNE